MKIIIGARDSGKTVEVVEYSFRTGVRIAVVNKRQKKLILETAEHLGIKNLPEPIVLNEIDKGAVGYRDEVILENADHFLKDMFGLNIVGITMNSDEVTDLNR